MDKKNLLQPPNFVKDNDDEDLEDTLNLINEAWCLDRKTMEISVKEDYNLQELHQNNLDEYYSIFERHLSQFKVWKKEEILYKKIMEIWEHSGFFDFFISGTCAYGPMTTGKSDLDIVLIMDDAAALEAWLAVMSIPVNREIGFMSFKFFLFRIGINIIVTPTPEVNKTWRRRTEAMKKIEPIKDRTERLLKFRSF